MFTHLHVASSYSMHHGVTDPAGLVAAAAAAGMGRLALTDRDGLYGAVKHVRACLQAGIGPIVGADLPVTGAGRVTVLAQPGGGYGQVCRLVSAAHAGGLTITRLAACDRIAVLLGGASTVGRLVAGHHWADARTALTAWRSVPGVHVEVVCHLAEPGQAESVSTAARMLELAEDLHMPAVLTNAVRYATPREAAIADVATAVAALSPLDQVQLPLTGQAWLKPETEMTQIARMVVDVTTQQRTAADLLAATETLAEECVLDPAADLGIGAHHLPENRVLRIGDADPMDTLWGQARAGLNRRYGHQGASRFQTAERRLAHELATVEKLRFAPYFLTVARVVGIIRGMGVRVQARGSGVGSVLNYVLDTSGVDPIEHGLLFERFLSGKRTTLPDIDIDVESARRHDIYRRLFDEFGSDRLALMSMVSTYGSRGAVRDAGLALGLDPDQVDAIAKSFWRFPARQLREALATKPELADLARTVKASAQLQALVAITERLDHLPRHVSMHPCGVIISDATLLDRTPVEASGLGLPMSQYDKHDMDPMGISKFDILGVRMQSAMAHAVTEIARTTGQHVDLDRVPRDDPAVYRMLRTTQSMGVFQLESPGQMQLLGKLQPETFDDLTLEISLFRPGAMKGDMVHAYLNRRASDTPVDYLDGRLRPILEETLGVVVYHEQVMAIIDLLTGCGLGAADEIRRQLKDPDQLPSIEAWIRTGASERGVPATVMDRLWPIIEGFGSFGFCKAHGTAFALPTYQSAWLKTHYPAAHLAGLLTHQPGMWGQDVVAAEARRLGIRLLPVDVQHSGLAFRVEAPDAIRIALTELAGITGQERQRIAAGQPFTSLADFITRIRPRKPTLNALAKVGALDAFIGYQPARRHDLLARIRAITRRPLPQPDGQLAFDLDLSVPESPPARDPDLSGRTQTDLELATMGMTSHGHRMTRFHPLLRRIGATPASRLLDLPGGTPVLVAGARRATNTPPMRSGRRTVFITLDDGTGLTHLVYFDSAQHDAAGRLFRTTYLLVAGRTQRAGARTVTILADHTWDLTEIARDMPDNHLAKHVRLLSSSSPISPYETVSNSLQG